MGLATGLKDNMSHMLSTICSSLWQWNTFGICSLAVFCFPSEHTIIEQNLGRVCPPNMIDGGVCSLQNVNSDFPEGLILFERPVMLRPSLVFQCFIH